MTIRGAARAGQARLDQNDTDMIVLAGRNDFA
jgi:hypothetical protein